jgi:hypothetical protein
MKLFVILLSFFLFSCNSKQDNTSTQDENIEKGIYSDSIADANLLKQKSDSLPKNNTCSIKDITILLEDKTALKSLFEQINTFKKDHTKDEYEFLNNDSIFFSLKEKYLIDFLKSLKEDTKGNSNNFEKEYEFNAYPIEYKSKKSCSDLIQLNFDKKDCVYTLTLDNNFYVEDFGCSEHNIFYNFTIKGKEIKLLNIDGAG